jgi:acyl-CoA dehydrogenase
VGCAVAFEAAGYSTLGPIALNIAAPDEGNMHLMQMVGTAAQKQHWLAPLARGETRSCFAMTEPDNGAGSDPSLLKTTARRDGNDYVINGRKWLITGARGAAFAIIMAKTEGGEHDGKATMFLSDMNRPGIVVSRCLDTMDSNFTCGHWVLDFTDLRVPESDVLGAIGQGFRYAQVRLAPARLTHCMRWLGAASRAHEIAVGYSRNRRAFGKTLGEHEGVGFMLADNEIDLHSSRLMILHTAWTLDQGRQASIESSMAKVFCSEALWRVADRCVQILGGLGITRDTVVERIFRDIRAFRIYDGPSEVHRWSLARHVQRA